MFFNQYLQDLALFIISEAKTKKVKIATAESCTGGLVSALFTQIPSSSKVFERGFVTYSNQAKIDLLNVNENTLEKFGAVSFEVAKEMVQGALNNSKANLAIAITGIAGPEGGTSDKPVGLVYISCLTNNHQIVRKYNFSGNRDEVRKQAMIEVLALIKNALRLYL